MVKVCRLKFLSPVIKSLPLGLAYARPFDDYNVLGLGVCRDHIIQMTVFARVAENNNFLRFVKTKV